VKVAAGEVIGGDRVTPGEAGEAAQFGGERVERYRSGDLGRIDSQVKIRGFRIELDEIRSVLLEDPAVRTAAVVVRRDDPTDAATARIDAYVVLSPGAEPHHDPRTGSGYLARLHAPRHGLACGHAPADAQRQTRPNEALPGRPPTGTREWGPRQGGYGQ
jgi:hypothetical protein